ncbi:neutral zinc metallopeptidase [Pseudolysinimonas sp.]|uniref:KPN_02809 family neutral zinc metallopeptidase n=1 Tax=Pseudolysinimonas sp. TaxID=2680009 RepID=UPI00286AABE8|nr:neutral zinc metallopeptidase [Pseudolysinimonas sp.]
MTFNDDANIGGGRVSKRGRNAALGAGGGGLVVIALVVVSQLVGVDLTGLAPILGGGQPTVEETTLDQCLTGEDANENIDCRMKGAAVALDAYWETQVEGYTAPALVIFEGSVSTGCGSATSAVGPFYCPPDQTVYIDTAFYQDLREDFGASGGPLAQLYVVAHEWGHHIQNITGTMNGLDLQDQGPTSDGVRLELQADCYAGAWVAAASTVPDESGTPFLVEPTDAEIADALNAAAAVGDDHIQETLGGGQVNPETWTHGSSESRQKWFNAGYTQGVGVCDTFAPGAQL